MVENGQFDERLVEPYPKEVEHGFRVFGFTMLGIGLTIAGHVVLTMLLREQIADQTARPGSSGIVSQAGRRA